MANSVYPLASREIAQKRQPLLPTSKQHSMPSARSPATGRCPRKPSRSSPSQSRTSRNARTASMGIPKRRCVTCNVRGAYGSNLGRRRDAGWRRLRHPALSLVAMDEAAIAPRAADGRRLRPPTEGHDDIGNKAAFTRAVETGLCATVSRRWCPRARRSPLATRPTQVGGGHRSVD